MDDAKQNAKGPNFKKEFSTKGYTSELKDSLNKVKDNNKYKIDEATLDKFLNADKAKSFNLVYAPILTGLQRKAKKDPKVKKQIDNLIEFKDSVVSMYFRSNPNNIDPNNFNADTIEDLDSTNSEQIYDDLATVGTVVDSPEHDTHLRGVLTKIINKVIDPLNLRLQRREQGTETGGVISVNDIYLSTAVPKSILAMSTKMSAKEVYIHELAHAIASVAINGSTLAARELRKLYKFALNAKDDQGNNIITPASFLREGISFNDSTYFEEMETAKEMYDYIFNIDKIASTEKSRIDPIDKQVHTDTLSHAEQEFFAYAFSNERFGKALEQLNRHGSNRGKISSETSWSGKFSALMDIILSWINSKILHTSTLNARSEIMVLAEHLANIHHKKKNILHRAYETGSNVFVKSMNTLIALVVYPLNKAIDFDIIKKSRFKPVRELRNIAKLIPTANFEMFMTKIQEGRRRRGKLEEGLTSSIINEVKGKDDYNTYLHNLLRFSGKVIDQTRQKIASHVARHLLDSYEGALTNEEKRGITKGILKTNLMSIVQDYSNDGLEKLYSDEAYLDSELDTVIKTIQDKYSKNVNTWYTRMGLSLGQFMTTGVPIERYHFMNSHLISNLTKTGLKQEGNIKEAQKLVGKLATLKSIKSMDRADKEALTGVMKREFARHPTENGIIFTMKVHNESRQNALENLFGDQEELMVEGYTKEIFNPNISFTTAPAWKKDELRKQGFEMKPKPLPKDRDVDPNKDPHHMFVNRNGMVATFMAGIMSYTSGQAKGANLTQIYSKSGDIEPALSAALDLPAINSKKDKIIRDIINNTAKPLDDGERSLIPIFNNKKGKVTNYRYMMSEFNKDELLEKNNSFEAILGGMEANISDKLNSREVNNRTIKATYEDWLKRFDDDPKAYIAIGPNVSNPKYVEIYQMLPAETRKEIERVWGSKTMYVRADVAILIFGQRKWSITNVKKVNEKAAGLEEAKRIANNAAAFVLDRPSAKIFENYLQEGIKLAKDAIVIKSGVVLLGNVISNIIELLVMRVPISDIVSGHVRAFSNARAYQKDTEELERLLREARLVPSKPVDKRRILELKNAITVNPVRELIELGIHQSIVEDVELVDETYSYKSQLEKKLNKNRFTAPIIRRTPELLKTVGKNLFMTHDTQFYKFMRDSTQISDFASRFVLHEHNMKKAVGKSQAKVNEIKKRIPNLSKLKADEVFNKEMTRLREVSINMIEDVFINYQLPTHKFIQYANDIGLFMFSKFFMRIQKIIAYMIKHHAGSLIGSLLIQDLSTIVGDQPDITDSLMSPFAVWDKFNTNLIGVLSEIWTAPVISEAVI